MPSSQRIWDRSSLTRLGVGIGGSLPKPSPGTESFLLPPAAACASLPHTCLSNLASEPDASAIQGGMVYSIQCFPITSLWLSHTQNSLVDLTSLTLPLRIVKPRIVHYWREISICWSSTCPGSLRLRSCWGRFCDFAIGFAQNDMRKEDMPRKMKIHQTGLEPEKSEINLSGKSFSKVLRLNEIFAIHWILSWMKWT